MSKRKKGYFVQGQFVAEGSALDLEFKREQEANEASSRSARKRASSALQDLGEAMLQLPAGALAALALPEALLTALAEVRRITDFEGRRRQMQFIGKQMRVLDPPTLEAIRAALAQQHAPSAHATQLLHQAEAWRERLLSDDSALGAWLQLSPTTDAQHLRALIRQANKDAKPQAPGQALRHGRAYRDIFQIVHAQLTQPASLPTTPAWLPHNPGADI